MELASDMAGTISSNTIINRKSKYRNWGDMEQGILLKIFMALKVMDLVGSVSAVCSTWHSVCHEPCMWETLNMSVLVPKLSLTPQEAHNFCDKEHRNKVTRFLNTALNLSRGKISCLIFNYYIPITDEQLIHASERTSKLKRLVLPPQNLLTPAGFEDSIKNWAQLESMTMPLCFFEFEMVKLICAHCKNFSELKLMCPFVVDFGKTIAAYIPNLRVLSLQGSLVEKEALVYILNNMKNLEVLNLCHCLLVDDGLPAPGYAYVARALDNSITGWASGTKKLYFCNSDYCRICQLMFVTEGSFGVVRHWSLAKGHSEYTCSTLIWEKETSAGEPFLYGELNIVRIRYF